MTNNARINEKQRRTRKASGGVTGNGFQPGQSEAGQLMPHSAGTQSPKLLDGFRPALDRESDCCEMLEQLNPGSSTPETEESAGRVAQTLDGPANNEVIARLQQAFASTDMELVLTLLIQAERAAGHLKSIDLPAMAHAFPVAAIHSIGPRDGTEALLAVQMVGVHRLAMRFLANAALQDQSDAGIELYTNRANRLLRTFTAQMEALKKHRSTGEQHVTVEHVTVQSGGQAVVGAVSLRQTPNGKTGGGDKGNVEQ